MIITERFFELNEQWNIVHLPERPNGFGVLIVGDTNHYVDSKTSSWTQNPERNIFIENLRNNGYTIFYSNLYERNWGSLKAINHLSRLYLYIMKREILNPKIHVICEGMGALAGLKWAEKMEECCVRSISLINPCIDLKGYIIHEKEKKLFYKRLLKELSVSYGIEMREIEQLDFNFYDMKYYQTHTPTKIWHVTQGTKFPVRDHSRKYEQHREEIGSPIELALQLRGSNINKFQEIDKYFKRHEIVL